MPILDLDHMNLSELEAARDELRARFATPEHIRKQAELQAVVDECGAALHVKRSEVAEQESRLASLKERLRLEEHFEAVRHRHAQAVASRYAKANSTPALRERIATLEAEIRAQLHPLEEALATATETLEADFRLFERLNAKIAEAKALIAEMDAATAGIGDLLESTAALASLSRRFRYQSRTPEERRRAAEAEERACLMEYIEGRLQKGPSIERLVEQAEQLSQSKKRFVSSHEGEEASRRGSESSTTASFLSGADSDGSGEAAVSPDAEPAAAASGNTFSQALARVSANVSSFFGGGAAAAKPALTDAEAVKEMPDDHPLYKPFTASNGKQYTRL